MYVDIHSHLDHPALVNNLDFVIDNARKSGVVKIITAGIDRISNRKAIEISKKYKDIVRFALGIYPPDALLFESQENNLILSEHALKNEIDFIKKTKPIAIGEVGLDFKYGKEKENQIKIFKSMIILAQELNLPLIVHSRGAERECISILEGMCASKVVMHCFNGNMKLVKRIEKNKWYLSIPSNIASSQHFQRVVKETDISRLLTETDSPFLGPAKIFPNEPKYVVETIKKIAEIKKMEIKEVENIIFMNFQQLF